MACIPARSLFLALPATLIAGSVWADLTPAEVWGDWKSYMQDMGYTVEGRESADGAALTVSDVTMRMELPEEEGAFAMSMGTLSFVEGPAGAVEVRMPETLPITIDFTPRAEAGEDDSEPVSMALAYIQKGQSLTASGSAEALKYDYAAETATIALTGLTVGKESYGAEQATFELTANGLNARSEMTAGETRGYAQAGRIDSLSYNVVMNTPDDPASLKLKGGAADITFDGGGQLPVMGAGDDMAAMLRAGMTARGNFSAGAGSSEMAVSDPENGDFTLISSSGGGKLDFQMGPEGLSYGGAQKQISVDVTAAEMPFPIKFSMAKAAFNMAMPVMQSDALQDFAFGVTLEEFQMSDMIWGIFDPAGQLPRDPATLVIDLSGKAKLMFDMMDPEIAEDMGDQEPGELHALSVNELSLDLAGAELDASGDLTFDNADRQTVPGMPKPVGALDLKLVGAVALMDKLVSMGLLPQEQAMGARMMLGLFAVPGEEENSLESRIEFTEEGAILANGQRVK